MEVRWTVCKAKEKETSRVKVMGHKGFVVQPNKDSSKAFNAERHMIEFKLGGERIGK